MTIRLLEDGSLLLNLYIQPKASRDQIVGLHGETLKVAITAPPVDGQANSALIRFLSKQFKVPKSQVVIEKGETGRYKQVRIIGPKLIPDIDGVNLTDQAQDHEYTLNTSSCSQAASS